MSSGSYGKGGDSYGQYCRGSGGSGGFDSGTLSVTPGAVYTVVVGAGGAGKRGQGTSSTYYANAGNSGFVMIQYGG